MSAPIGNKYAQEWTLENALPRFEDALKFAETDDTCLCLQDAIYSTCIPYTTFYYLCDTQEVLNCIKKNIHDAVIRRINRLALDKVSAVPAAPAIWRMKQLGERDEVHQTVTSDNKTSIAVTSKETEKQIGKLIKKFETE
jgi:hypothetical protein